MRKIAVVGTFISLSLLTTSSIVRAQDAKSKFENIITTIIKDTPARACSLECNQSSCQNGLHKGVVYSKGDTFQDVTSGEFPNCDSVAQKWGAKSNTKSPSLEEQRFEREEQRFERQVARIIKMYPERACSLKCIQPICQYDAKYHQNVDISQDVQREGVQYQKGDTFQDVTTNSNQDDDQNVSHVTTCDGVAKLWNAANITKTKKR